MHMATRSTCLSTCHARGTLAYQRACILPAQAVQHLYQVQADIALQGLVVVEWLVALVVEVGAARGLLLEGAALEVMVVGMEVDAEDVTGADEEVRFDLIIVKNDKSHEYTNAGILTVASTT